MNIHRPLILTALACTLVFAGCGSSSSSSNSSSSSSPSGSSSTTASRSGSAAGAAVQIGFEGVGIQTGSPLAPAGTTQTGKIDGIDCGPTEQLAYHIHVHLAVYAGGSLRTLPGGVGIPGSQIVQTSLGPVAAGGQCIYWLHTHAPDGIIHVESPIERVYTLGTFFDEWHQPLSSNQVAGITGKVTALVDGKPWPKSPSAIPLLPHAVIQLNVDSPNEPFHPMSWSGLRL